RQSGACTGVNSTSDYWNNAGSGQGAITCKISFPNPIPLWQIENAQLTVTGVGDSWHGGFAVTFDLPQTGANPAGAYYAFTTRQNMFFNGDPGNGGACDPGYKVGGWVMTLLEPGDSNAIQMNCPSGAIRE